MDAGSPRYRILKSLGKGGIGEVFLAEDRQLERKVALKFLPEELAADPVARQRFEREAKSAAALDHPFICKIHEIAKVDGKTCIAMEHVSGQTLDQVLADGPLEPSRALEIAAEVVEALEQAHARRVLHRDLKPSNLMLTPERHVKVMDFGLAKRLREPATPESQAVTHDTLTGMGAFIGTPAYMAPEQIRGGEADTRSDVFSFGIVLYELLEGTHPFRKGHDERHDGGHPAGPTDASEHGRRSETVRHLRQAACEGVRRSVRQLYRRTRSGAPAARCVVRRKDRSRTTRRTFTDRRATDPVRG